MMKTYVFRLINLKIFTDCRNDYIYIYDALTYHFFGYPFFNDYAAGKTTERRI